MINCKISNEKFIDLILEDEKDKNVLYILNIYKRIITGVRARILFKFSEQVCLDNQKDEVYKLQYQFCKRKFEVDNNNGDQIEFVSNLDLDIKLVENIVEGLSQEINFMIIFYNKIFNKKIDIKNIISDGNLNFTLFYSCRSIT